MDKTLPRHEIFHEVDPDGKCVMYDIQKPDGDWVAVADVASLEATLIERLESAERENKRLREALEHIAYKPLSRNRLAETQELFDAAVRIAKDALNGEPK